jgi:hypothetical protein
MSRLGGWLRSAAKPDSGADAAVAADKEREHLTEAMNYTQHIMNDDVDKAYEFLKAGNSSFHRLGASVSFFLRSVLGFEKQIIVEATAMLDDCESKAWDDLKKAQKRGPRGNSIYPAGTEYELVLAQAQLMGAVVGVLQESLIEAMKSFYKLRKAFITLDAIIAVELRAQKDPGESAAPTAPPERTPGSLDDDEDSGSDDFVDAKEDPSKLATPDTQSATNLTTPEDSLADLKLRDGSGPVTPQQAKSAGIALTQNLALNHDDIVDVFIHSGANMCFGLILLLLTLVPPAFSRILSVVGFNGDRARGIHMLWQSSQYDNINGAIAGMVLLAYYNGLLGVVDILPQARDFDESAETFGPPREKCDRLLAAMRKRYPDSRMWRIEEARQMSSESRLREAVEVLKGGAESKMRQVTALNDFELALDAMYLQDWPLMRDTFLRCLEVNDWSPAMYYYLAGCATLEMYRDAMAAGDEGEARRQKAKAEGYLRKAPGTAGKKRFMAKQLPFEVFIQRKLKRWEERAAALKVDLADAVGSSPVVEMVYMWNGIKKMAPEEVDKCLANLEWSRCTCSEEVRGKIQADVDESGGRVLFVAALHRRRGNYEEARKMLQDEVLAHDLSVITHLSLSVN